jgi:hypothetical protein
MVIKYIQENGKRPSTTDKNPKIKKLRGWLTNQDKYYKLNKCCMVEISKRKQWEEFKQKYQEHFIDNIVLWHKMLNKLIIYIQTYNTLPTERNKDPDVALLASWMSNQRFNYSHYKDIMKKEVIRNKWKEVVEQYPGPFKPRSGEVVWFENYTKVVDYIKTYDCLPNSNDENPDIKYLGRWLGTQRDNYIKNRCIMTTPIIKETWEDFMIKFKKYSKNPRDVWFQSFQRVKDYLEENGKLPSGDSTDEDIRYLGRWIGCQNSNLKKAEHSMNDPEFKKLWVEFRTANLGLFPSKRSAVA